MKWRMSLICCAGGRALDATYGYVCEGFFQDQADIEKHAKQTFGTVRPGDLKYKDINGDGVINSDDQIDLGCRQVVYITIYFLV